MDISDTGGALYEGHSATSLTEQLGFPVLVYPSVSSTMDVAHDYAARTRDRPALILANTQTAGRGRSGHRWSSPQEQGIWLTLVERVTDRAALDVLSLRVGLGAARALSQFTAKPIQLKWPNDLYIEGRKLAGTLVEVRWRNDEPEWVAIGFGVNLIPPYDHPDAAGLDEGTRRLDVLPSLVHELRVAAHATGALTCQERDAFHARDLARDKMCIEPVCGRVRGISSSGELMVDLVDTTVHIRTGSLILEQ